MTGIMFVAAGIIVLTNINCNFSHQKMKPGQDSAIVENGAALYQTYCAMCHGKNGEGYLADEAPALSNQDFLAVASDDYILQGILRGRPGTPMSAWDKQQGGPLTEEDATAILSFIRTWQKEPSIDVSRIIIAGDRENGVNVFERWCAACHGKYGAGGKAVKLNNPVFQETASDGFIRYTIENGRRRTPMISYKNILNYQEIDDVVAYIRTLKTESALIETVAVNTEELSKTIREGVLNPGNPPASFSLIDNRYAPADDVFAAYSAGQSFMIIDARPQSDYLRSHIQGAVSIPFYDVDNAVSLLPKDMWIIFYCACPHALSGKAADKLRTAGYDKVAVLDEGLIYWQDKGYPMESAIGPETAGKTS
jgi:cytochrome c oxidase cbb3-type subunit 3/ubiquinol-cytochrome c reductase cytochrome c subunit